MLCDGESEGLATQFFLVRNSQYSHILEIFLSIPSTPRVLTIILTVILQYKK